MKTVKLILMTILISATLIAQVDKTIKWWDVGSNQFKVQPIPWIVMDTTAATINNPPTGSVNIFFDNHKLWARTPGGTNIDLSGGGGGDFANRTLNNLTSTAINTHLIPNGIYDLGSINKPWGILHTYYKTPDEYDPDGGIIFIKDLGNYIVLEAPVITGTRNIIVPDATGTMVISAASPLTVNSAGQVRINTSGVDANSILRYNGSVWETRRIHYTATLNAATDEAEVTINGLTANSVVYASWGKPVNSIPLGSLYVVSTGNNTCKIRSNADEINAHNIIVTVVSF